MLKLFRIEHPNAEELMKDVEIPTIGDSNIVDPEYFGIYCKCDFVFLVYAQSIDEIKEQYKNFDCGGNDPEIYYEAYKNGIIKEVKSIVDLDDINYYYISGESVLDQWLPDVCESKTSLEYNYEEEYVMDFLKKKQGLN